MLMRSVWLVVVLVACNTPRHKEKEIDATTFVDMLHDREKSAAIQSIQIDPQDHGDARYAITLKATPVVSVASSEYPGTIVDDIVAAGVPYLVGDPGERREHEKL